MVMGIHYTPVCHCYKCSLRSKKCHLYMSTWELNPDMHIACWYGEKEMNMKKAVKHLKRAFPNIEVHPFVGLGYGEIMRHESLLVRELKAFMEKVK